MPIDTGRSYLQKHRFAPRQILSAPDPALAMVVVIPSHCEPDLVDTLASLAACELPPCAVEVLVVLNLSAQAEAAARARHVSSIQAAKAWLARQQTAIRFHLLDFPQLPDRHAGVGLARKIGMDEAVDRLEQVGHPEGVIVCLDADSLVDRNYLVEVYQAFAQHPKAEAAAIYFEHPTAGAAFEADIYRGIVRYELFLRYYIQGLRFAGYPYATHTVGSSMAVRSRSYQVQGGMNRRKAGEDFYFLHKFLPGGQVVEVNTTRVIPSPRAAEQVPFGTGRAMNNWLAGTRDTWPVYAPETFRDLQSLTRAVPNGYDTPFGEMPEAVAAFLEAENFPEVLAEIRGNVSGSAAFAKRFYQWFDGLKVLKYVHFVRDHVHPNGEIIGAAARLYEWAQGEQLDLPDYPDAAAMQLLGYYRALDRAGSK